MRSGTPTFASGFVENLGMEPAFVGAVFGAEKGKITGPVKGTQGVSVLVVDNLTEPSANADFQTTRTQMQQQLQQRTSFEVFNALKEKADITDNRSRFY